MPHLSRYHTLHVAMCEMRIWPRNAAKCCKNAGKFFPDVVVINASRSGQLTMFKPILIGQFYKILPFVKLQVLLRVLC